MSGGDRRGLQGGMFQTEETARPRRGDWERKGHLVPSGGCVGLEGRGGYWRWGGMGREEVNIKGSNGREGPAGLDVRQCEGSKGFRVTRICVVCGSWGSVLAQAAGP